MEFNIVSNFIESRAMRIGDWETARRLFMEVTERAEKHAVAHFFLSIVEDKLGLVSESQKNIKIANKIVDKDGKWKNIFDKYNLTFNEKLSEYSK
jgi:hypothetical protein